MLIIRKDKNVITWSASGIELENLKPYTANVKVTFDIDFEVIAGSAEQAQTKVKQLLEIIERESTIDCHLASEYDVHVSETGVTSVLLILTKKL